MRDDKFDASATSAGDFTLASGADVEVEMMHQSKTRQYYQGDGFEALRVPYEDSHMSMWILLPETDGLDELESSLSRTLIDEVEQGFTKPYVMLTLPKFKILSELALSKALTDLGMPTAFGGNADFSDITDADIRIEDVYQDACLAVGEQGTEAAAATAVVFADAGLSLYDDVVEFTVDHPFVFLLREDPTGALLFVGRVTDPRD